MILEDTSVSLETDTMISVRDLRVNYGEREILHGVNFDVNRGETMVILGGSGSGKSTLLRTLVGLEKPSSGQIWIKGKDIATIPVAEMDEIRKKIGMSFQGSALFGSMTVGENVALPLREHTKLEDSTIEIMLRLKLEQVGLAGLRVLHALATQRWHEETRRRRSCPRHGSGDPFLRRALCRSRPHHRRRHRPAHSRVEASAFRMTIIVVTHELGQRLPDRRSHDLDRQRQRRGQRSHRRDARQHPAARAAISGSRGRARSGSRVGLFADAHRKSAFSMSFALSKGDLYAEQT